MQQILFNAFITETPNWMPCMGRGKPEMTSPIEAATRFLMVAHRHFCSNFNSFDVTAAFDCEHNGGSAICGV
jgi:hypothetical protein